MHAAIGKQYLGFADAAGIENDLPGRGITGVVLIADTEIEIAERHPDPLAAPAHMDGLALERHRAAECRAGLGRQLVFETSLEREVTGVDNELAHSFARDCEGEFQRCVQPKLPGARNILADRPSTKA